MAEFQGIFCRPFLLSILIIKGVGGMGSGVGWGGVGWGEVGGKVAKTTARDTPRAAMTSTQWPITHQWATQSVGANSYRSPLSNWCPPSVPLFQL